MARSLLVLAALLALGAQGEMGKYGCHFDCYMTEEKVSARGYLEYACNSSDNSTINSFICGFLIAVSSLLGGNIKVDWNSTLSMWQARVDNDCMAALQHRK